MDSKQAEETILGLSIMLNILHKEREETGPLEHTGSTSLITPTKDSSAAFSTLTNISGMNHGPSLSPPAIKRRSTCWLAKNRYKRMSKNDKTTLHRSGRVGLCSKTKKKYNSYCQI